MRAATVSVIGLLLIVAGSFNAIGKSARVRGERESVYVEAPSVAFRAFRDSGMLGGTIVSLSQMYYFVPYDLNVVLPEFEGYPANVPSLSESYGKYLSDNNFLLVALESGVARRIVHIIPDRIFRERASPSDGAIHVYQFIYPRLIASGRSQEAIGEPYALFVDPTFFRWSSPEEALEMPVLAAPPKFVIACTLESDPSVTPSEREALRKFMALIDER